MSDKGLLASICGFIKGLFSSDDDFSNTKKAGTSSANNDGLTGVERYLRGKGQNGGSMTGVERFVRNQLSSNTSQTGVEQYVRSKGQAKPETGVEKYIRSKA